MAGEMDGTSANPTFTNKGNANLLPNTCCDVDVTNSDAFITAVGPCSGALGEVIGVIYDQAKLNPDGSVVKNSGLGVRSWGIARIVAAGAISAGDFVSVAGVNGQIQTQAKAGAGVQLKPIVGRALTLAGAANDQPLVMLMIGARI